MASPIAPDVAPVLSRDRGLSAKVPARPGGGPVVTVALVAILALVGLGLWRSIHQSAAVEPRVKVVAAGKDIPAGVRLGFTTLHYVDIPRPYMTPDMVTSTNQVAGRVTRCFVPMGEPILGTMLFPGHDGLSLNIENDERALTLDLSEDALVDHSIYPGDRVDILVTSTRDGKKFTKTLCQEVRVLMSVPKEALLTQRVHSSEQNRITLAVTPEQGEVLTEAAEVGKLRLVLRNRLSRGEEHLSGTDQRDLLPAQALIDYAANAPAALPPPPLVPAPPPPAVTAAAAPAGEEAAQEAPGPLQWVVEVISGSRREKYAVPQR